MLLDTEYLQTLCPNECFNCHDESIARTISRIDHYTVASVSVIINFEFVAAPLARIVGY